MISYLFIGLGVHLGLSVARWGTYKQATLFSVVLGFVFCVTLWPVGLIVIYLIDQIEDTE